MSRHCSSVKSVGYDLSFIAPLPQNLTPTRRVNNSPDQMSRDNNCLNLANLVTDMLSELSRGDLEALTERLLAENAALKQVVADLRAGIVRLKGVTGGPAIRPSGVEQKTEPKPTDKTGKRGAKQRKTGH